MLTDEDDKSNCLGVNIKKNPDGKLKVSQSHMEKKIIKHVRLTVYTRIKARDTTTRKPLRHKYGSSIVRQYIWKYRAVVGMLSYIQVT